MPLKKQEELVSVVESEFSAIERDAEAEQPGLNDLLAVYGGYEQAVREAEEYLSQPAPTPVIIASDSSSK